MADGDSLEHLMATRNLLKTTLEKSRDVSCELEKTSPRLEKTNQRLEALRASMQPIPDKKCALAESIKEHINLIVGPAAAIIRVFNVVHGLEKSLSSNDPCFDLVGYLALVNRYEEGLRFLANNCNLISHWLEDTIQLLVQFTATTCIVADNNGKSNNIEVWGLSEVNKSLRILQDLAARQDHARLRGGLLDVVFDKLEAEFRRLMRINRKNISLPSAKTNVVIKKLEGILNREIDLTAIDAN